MLDQAQLRRVLLFLGMPQLAPPPTAAAANTPDSVADLLLWLDGSDTQTLQPHSDGSGSVAGDGDRVGRWADKSGSGIHFTQDSADNRPLWRSGGAVDLAGAHWLTNHTVSRAPGDYTIILGLDLQAPHDENDEYLLDIQSGRLVLATSRGGNGQMTLYASGWNFFGGAVTGKQVLVWRLDSGDRARLYRNGVEVGGGIAYTPVGLGGVFALGGLYLLQSLSVPHVAFYQLCLYPRALTNGEINAVAGWVAGRIGVAWSEL
jgi:hypothetical protein